jgi:dipeptidyl aminopeptidase/acylaminoacyl peptidase
MSAGLALSLALTAFVSWPSAQAADVQADYERAASLRDRVQDKVYNVAGEPTWLEGTTRFWYRKSVDGGDEFVLVDAAAATRAPAFDHARLATSLSSASGESYTALTLPFTTFDYLDDRQAIQFTIGGVGRGGGGPVGQQWRCTLTDYSCSRQARQGGQGRTGGPGRGGRGGFGGPQADDQPQFRESPDGKHEAFIQNFNLFVREKGADLDEATALSWDGSEGNAYRFQSIRWSPDSTKIAAYRRRPGYDRQMTFVQSSPADQLQPKAVTRSYRKPGDEVDYDQPVLFDLPARSQRIIDAAHFPNPYQNGNMEWREDSRAFTFEYNQRGHQVYRVLEVNASTGAVRTLIDETTDTFIDYRRTSDGLSNSGRTFRHDVGDGGEIVWLSERDGWSHLYLYDATTGRLKNQITSGAWAVHHVERVDDERRQIWFTANGMDAGQDPYFLHHYRVNFDGTGLTRFTQANATHSVTWSDDREFYVDRYQRVDMAPVAELRRTSDQSLVMELERGDMTALLATGWRPPEVFTSKGRDGTTDIWGVIVRPTNFDANRRYPVIENIYAGPQGSFVPKTFSTQTSMQTLAELGFVVVQIDGMGTANRSKAFHAVAYQDLGDAGFPDRILWHQSVAAKYLWYDISRVGIYGTSAGGQNAMGGVLFHPEFYKAAAASSGCHDNRMDKIWWNEQWMGWPLGPHYAASSNVDHAHRLQGDLLLIVGEMDTNVDPASTMQVVNALIEANKNFEMLVVPNAGHTSGGAYGDHRRFDFFVRSLQGRTPPAWNTTPIPNSGIAGVSVLDLDAMPWVEAEGWGR